MPAESLEALYLDHFLIASDAALYDFIVAQDAYPFVEQGWEGPGELSCLSKYKPDGDFTKKASGAAYAWKDRGDWDDEKRMIVPPVKAEPPPWYLHVPAVVELSMWDRIIEPHFSQPALQGLVDEHMALDWIELGYDCACGMSEECLIALEQHFLELHQDDSDYRRQVIEYEVDTQNWVGKDICWWQALSGVIDNAFGPSKQGRYNPAYLDYERRVNKGDLGTEIFGVDLLSLPINAQAATYYEAFDAQAIVAKFEHVEISSIPAEKMTCIICLDDFDKAEDNKSNDDEA
ncbi:hypothetical protein G6514_006056 [Epicoccum nigrum]|nr:hypothetical protein G6514_006056 [Epicoccum nigrum]